MLYKLTVTSCMVGFRTGFLLFITPFFFLSTFFELYHIVMEISWTKNVERKKEGINTWKNIPEKAGSQSHNATSHYQFIYKILTFYLERVARSVGHLTRKSGVLGSIPSLATYFRFSL